MRRPRRTHRLAITATLALAAAACTTEQDSAPGPTLTSTTSTTSTTAPSTTTTTVAPTTTPVTTGSTTTTTLTGPSADLVPLFIGGADSTGWLFLGAWQRDRWQSASDPGGNPIRPGVEAGTSFTISNLSDESTATIGENTEACFDGRVGPSIAVEPAPAEPAEFGYSAVAVLTQPWPLKPRPVAVTARAPGAYQVLGETAFEDDPVDATLGGFEQLVVTDLDGDGDDEALAVFEFVQPGAGPGTAGDFSALLLIDVDTRTAETVAQSSIDEDAGDPDTASAAVLERYRVLDVADLNGDGRMEVLVHAWYYEGASVVVHTYDGTGLTEVLSTGCGA